MASQPPRPSSSPKHSDKGEMASSLKYLNKRTSSLKYGGKDGKTEPQRRSVQPPLVPGAEGSPGRRRLPWMTLIKAVGRFQRLISEVRQSQTLSSLNPLAMELNVPQKHPIPEKEFWGDQEPLSKIPFQILTGHQQLVSSCHFCVNDTKLLSGSFDCTVKLWVGGGNKASCQLTLPLVESSPVLKSRSQGSQGFGEAFLSKVQEGETKTRAHMSVKPLERDEDAMDGSIIRDFDDGPKAPVLECSVTADSRRITAAAYDKTLRTWDLETGKLLWKVRHEGFITSCNFSPDGKYVVSGLDVDHGICITDARNAMTVAHIKDHHKRSVTGCCFDPDSQKVASVSLDKSVKIWDITSQATLLTINTAHDNAVSSCCFTFSGHFLCTSSWDKTLKIWNVHTGEFRNQGACATLMHGHEGSVSSCQFARDTSVLVSGGFDKTVAIWDVGEGYLKHSLKGHSDWVMDVAISNNKKWILSASKDKTMRLWNIEEIDQIPLVIKCKEARGLKVNQCEACERPFSTYDSDVFSETVTKCVFCRMDASLSAEASSSERKGSPARECSLGKDN